MKLSASQLKNFDYKQFGIDHGEKVAIGLVALLLAWALWVTNWQRYDKGTPEDLSAKAKQAEAAVLAAKWPETEAKSLGQGTEVLAQNVDKFIAPIDASPFELPVSLHPSIGGDKSRISTPKWLAVEDLRADAGYANLVMKPTVDDLKDDFRRPKPPKENDKDARKSRGGLAKGKKGEPKQVAAKPKMEDEEANSEFAPKQGLGRRGATPFGNLKKGREDKRGPGRRGGEAEEATLTLPEIVTSKMQTKTRGYRFVAVRGVYPLREQAQELARAYGDPSVSPKQYQDQIEIDDVKLERQAKVPGPNPWSGPWEPIDKDFTYDLYNNYFSDWAPETVADTIIDRTICPPYPERFVGTWGDFATHPRIKEFELTDEEVETQAALEWKMLDRVKEETEKFKRKSNKKGFADLTQDFRRIRRAVSLGGVGGAESKSVLEQLYEDVKTGKKLDDQDGKLDEQLKEYIKKHGTPADHLLLFRYLDFNVAPGETYRYRVSVVLKNPFTERHPEEVADPSLTQGEFRDSEVSEPTAPVSVPEDAQFFLARADGHVGRPYLPNIDVDLFQWFISTGTIVNQKLFNLQIGQSIGGRKDALVLRPAEDVFEKEGVPFSTKRTLLDVDPGFSLDTTLHADLLSDLQDKGKRTAVVAPDEAVVVDENGNVALLDGSEQQEAKSKAASRYDRQIKPWKDLLNKDKEDADSGRLDLRHGANPLTKTKSKRGNPWRKAGGGKKGDY